MIISLFCDIFIFQIEVIRLIEVKVVTVKITITNIPISETKPYRTIYI